MHTQLTGYNSPVKPRFHRPHQLSPSRSLLVGEGAVRWAEAQSLPVASPVQLVTPEAQRRFDKYKRSLDEAETPRLDRKRQRLEAEVRHLGYTMASGQIMVRYT